MKPVFSERFAIDFAANWIAAWNARDLNRIQNHYTPDVEFTSPFVNRLLPGNHHTLRGIALLRVYFSRALNAYPDLHFVSRRVYYGAESLVIEYESVSNLLAAEMMELNDAGLIRVARVHYTGLKGKSAKFPWETEGDNSGAVS